METKIGKETKSVITKKGEISSKRKTKIDKALESAHPGGERQEQLKVMSNIMKKRKKNAKWDGVTSALDTAAGAFGISAAAGFAPGAIVSGVLGGVSTGIKGARAGGKAFKQWGRDRRARHERKPDEIKADRKAKKEKLTSATEAPTGWNPLKKFGKWNAKRQLNTMKGESDEDYAKRKNKKYQAIEKEKGFMNSGRKKFEGLFNAERSTKVKDEENAKLVKYLMKHPKEAKMFSGGAGSQKFSQMKKEDQRKFLEKRVKQR